jgi:hypothetical protein
VELTGPYFHTGSKLTLRQQLDFYDRGGDFPISNSPHRDFLIMHFDIEDEALGGYLDPVTGLPIPRGTPGAVPEFTEEQKEAIKIAVIDFLVELTDERVAFERAPFDHPEMIVPLDGRAPENHGGRAAMLAATTGDCAGVAGAGPCFRVVPAVGELGNLGLDGLPGTGDEVSLPRFLGITKDRCTPKAGGIQFGPGGSNTGGPFPGSPGSFIVPECSTLSQLSQYDSDTTRLAVAAASAIGSTSAGATVAATSGAGSPVLARNTGITFAAPTVSPVSAVTLDISPSGLQAAGTTVTFSAAASGGSGTYQYRFWVHDGTSWKILQDFGSAATYEWTPPAAGTYVVQVHARSAGSAAPYEAWTGIEYSVQ